MARVYKIVARDEWRAAQAAGRYDGSADDRRDGFIHFSTASQARATANKHFAGREDLLLIAFEAEALGARLKWEPSRGGALFPHLHGDLDPGLALETVALRLGGDGRHVFPEGFGR